VLLDHEEGEGTHLRPNLSTWFYRFDSNAELIGMSLTITLDSIFG